MINLHHKRSKHGFIKSGRIKLMITINRILVFYISFFITIAQSSFASGNRAQVEGSDRAISREINVGAFDKVITSITGFVNLHIAPEYRVTILCDDNLIQYVDIQVNNGELKIDTKNRRRNRFRNLVIDVYAPNINTVSLTGTGTTKGAVECEDFTSHLTGTGTIEIIGIAKTATIMITGTGSFLGRDFKINEAKVFMTGTGLVEIWAIDRIDGNLTGTGTIRYDGRPQISYSGTGTGRIEPIDK